ncbi:hypothetical protein M3Y99_00570600 [Aphelenchoides fujianensis]|nr:hypothetical protein M3Y99_00570600 [Aphelenchoides fujianensis]
MIPAFIRLGFLLVLFSNPNDAVKCVSCVGRGCMRKACEGDMCVSSFYAAKWNDDTWTKAKATYGCVSGNMTTTNFHDHCETTTDEFGTLVQTCLCQSPLCNGGRKAKKLPKEEMKFVECNCEGRHCKQGPTCRGRFCTYVINHLTMHAERGCSNVSVPLLARRVGASCSTPPLVGSLHTNVARTGDDLLHTESCLCQSDYCNRDRPLVVVQKEMKCGEKIRGTFYGQRLVSTRHRDCMGEFCFQTDVKSELGGQHSEFAVSGCISFGNESVLAEEFEPTGCAYFATENLRVRSCFDSSDAAAIERARNSRVS